MAPLNHNGRWLIRPIRWDNVSFEPSFDPKWQMAPLNHKMEETNTILRGFDRDGGDECESNLAGSAVFVLDVKPGGDVHSILPNQRSPLEYKVDHVVNILQLTVSDDCLLTSRVEKRSRGFPKPRDRALTPSPPARLLLTGGLP